MQLLRACIASKQLFLHNTTVRTVCGWGVKQDEVEAAFEALTTLRDVSVACDNGVLCSSTVASTCSVEFLTELADVPLVSVSIRNVDSISVTENQVGRGAHGGKPVWLPRAGG